jgi:TPR repeat protein
MAELKKAAEAHDPQACVQYGEALLRGDGVTQDIPQAILYLREAGDTGEPNALFRLGKIYDDGELTPKDYPKAFDYYTSAAKAGNAASQYNLGVMYVSAHGVKRDYVEGLAWLIVAEKNGVSNDGEKQVRERLQKNNRQQQISSAEQRAAEILKDITAAVPGGPSVPPVDKTTNQAPNRVEIGGSGPSKINIALPSSPLPDISKDIASRLRTTQEQSPPVNLATPRQTVLSWPSLLTLKDEAAQGRPSAIWALGKIYLDGDLIPADATRAIQLLEQAATAGNADAAYQLGEVYSKDTYVKHDDAKVFTYFQQAARGKVPVGFYNLGTCYVNGRGVAKNLTEGLAWLMLAKKHDVDPRTEIGVRLQLKANDPGKIPLAEERAAQLEQELFPSQDKSPATTAAK